MGNYEQLKRAIADLIKQNGRQEITGNVLQGVLKNIVSVVGKYSYFAGVATPSTNPGTPDQNVFYIAAKEGVYANLGGTELKKGDTAIFEWTNGRWNFIPLGLMTKEGVVFDASELYLCAVKNQNGGIVSEKFLADVIEAVNDSRLMYLENTEPSGFKFKVIVVFAGMNSTTINFNASDTKAHYRIILDRATRKATYEIIEINLIKSVNGQTGNVALDGANLNIGGLIGNKSIAETIFEMQSKEDDLTNLHNEYNVSNGVYGGASYTKAEAVALINNVLTEPQLQNTGLRIVFIDKDTNKAVTYVYQGQRATPVEFAKVQNWEFAEVAKEKAFFLPNSDISKYKGGIINIIAKEDLSKDGKTYYLTFFGIRANDKKDCIIVIADENGNLVHNDHIDISSGGIKVSEKEKFIVYVDCDNVPNGENYPTYGKSLIINKYNYIPLERLKSMELDVQRIKGNVLDISKITNPIISPSFVKSVKVVDGNLNSFYNSDGTLKRLFLTFFRFAGIEGQKATIAHITWKDGDKPLEINKNLFCSISGDTEEWTGKPFINLTLKGNDDKNLKIDITFDMKYFDRKVHSSFLGEDIEINTQKIFVEFQNDLDLLAKYNVFKRKTIVCFGDSVTEFGEYPKYISEITGAKVYKIGFGGCQMAKRSGDDEWSVAYNSMAMYNIAESILTENYDAMIAGAEFLANRPSPDDNRPTVQLLQTIDFDKVDLITIFFGTNDFTSDNPLGLSESVSDSDVRGAMNNIIRKIQSKYPHIRIAFITPTHRFFGDHASGVLPPYDSDISKNIADIPIPKDDGYFLKDLCDAELEQANLNHIPCLDMYRNGGFNKYNHNYYFGVDGVHPKEIGYRYIAEKISAFISGLFKYQ